eukprot:111627_1
MAANSIKKSRKSHKSRLKKGTKVSIYDFENDCKQTPKAVDIHQVMTEMKHLNATAECGSNKAHDMMDLKVSTLCVLCNLQRMSAMNHKKCRIIGPLYQQRYPVFVYDTKQIVLIKPSNLKLFSPNTNCKDELHQILRLSASRNHQNMANMFASKLMKSNYNQLNTKLMDDFKTVLEGNCIYIPHFLCRPSDCRLLHQLKKDIASYSSENQSNQGMVDWSKHLKHENPSFSEIFNRIIEHISTYFDMDVFASRLNYYRNGKDYKPYHHDSHAYLQAKNVKEDFTIGVSFGQERILSFKHCKTDLLINIPQRNGDCFAFNSIVNKKYQHGILKGQQSADERFSLIAWGKRRTFNDKNSGISERQNDKTFTGRQVV